MLSQLENSSFLEADDKPKHWGGEKRKVEEEVIDKKDSVYSLF